MRNFINIIESFSNIEPHDIVEDDGDVPHALYAVFDEEGVAYMRYWGISKGGIALQAIHSSEDIRGRDMLVWLNKAYGRHIHVIEAIPEALGFWDTMQDEGLVVSIDVAEGHASNLEKMSVALPPIGIN